MSDYNCAFVFLLAAQSVFCFMNLKLCYYMHVYLGLSCLPDGIDIFNRLKVPSLYL